MNLLRQDLRYGARMLIRNPDFTLIAVIVMALGRGANTAIFSASGSRWERRQAMCSGW